MDLIAGDTPGANAKLHEAVQIYAAIGDRYSIPAQIGNFGWTLRRMGRSADARPYFLQAAQLFEDMGLMDYAQQARHAAESEDQTARLLQQWQPVLALLGQAVHGDADAGRQLSLILEALEKSDDWRHLSGALRRILAGERDPASLAAGLDETDRVILAAALQQAAGRSG